VTADASTLADVTGIAAEYARLVAEAARATKRQQDLQAKRPDRGDTEAYAAHKELENAATEAVYEADDAVDAYLGEHPDAVPVYGAARRWLDLGVCTVPVKNDGSKRPIGEWKEYQERLPTSDELFGWHHRGGSGLGIVTGRTGREDGLAIEMFELEARAVSEGILDKFTDALKEAGLWEVWLRITAGFWDVSPSGGFHAYWYCEDVTGNVKLAQREATPEELVIKPGDKYRTLIETRGRGGFTVIAPTPGSYHETGRAWEAQGGPPEALAIITAEQREGIFTCVCCGAPLFASDSKFESGTGWPSFYKPMSDDAVAEHEDRSFLMRRTEVRCARCDAHLGHVFPDGPKPTGQRYCMNGVALDFKPGGKPKETPSR